jgi:hypothetical protein
MASVAQFFHAADDTISTDGTGQEKIIIDNLPSTIALLADVATGTGVTSKVVPAVPGANIAPGFSVTATAEPGKVNLLANIISACVNAATASAAPCTTLFSAAVPPVPNTTPDNPNTGFPAATDTLQALYYIIANPANSTNGQGSNGAANVATLFGLAGGVGAPYQPSAAQPTDWTIAINYTGNGTCGTGIGGTGGFISSPVDINIDAQDAVWIANSQTGGNLSAIASGGAPLACINMDPGSSNAGGTLDAKGNIWFAGGTTMYRYNQNTQVTVPFPVAVSPLAITADGLGNVYFTAVADGAGSLYQLPLAATAGAAVTPVQISNTVGPNPTRMMPDYKSTTVLGNIWVSSGSNYISQVTAGTGTGSVNGFITFQIAAFDSGSSYGVAVDAFNAIVTSEIDAGTVNVNTLVFNGSSYSTAGGWPFTANTAGISSPTGISVDGRGTTWLPNNASPSISELSLFGANPLSPSTGFQKASTFLNAGRASAVDQAGNIWIAGDGNTFLTEIVGAAVPIYQPYAVGLANGRFQQIP